MLFQIRSSSEHKLRYFWWNLSALRPSIDNKDPYKIKIQKHSKEIGIQWIFSKMALGWRGGDEFE